VHYEACTHLHRTVHAIKKLGALPGGAESSLARSLLEEIIPDADLVMLMSVNPVSRTELY